MQIVLLTGMAFFCSLAAVWGTRYLLAEKRTGRADRILFAGGMIVCFVFSVLIDCVIRAGRPTFYYHTHHPGMATVKLFGSACVSGCLFFSLFIMLAERKKQRPGVFRWIVRSILIGLCGAIILEVGYFNFRHFELIGSGASEQHIPGENIYCAGMYFNRAAWKFIPYEWNEKPEFFVYANYTKVRNVSFEFGTDDQLELVELKFDDSAHRRLESIGEHRFIPGISRSYSVPLHTVGVTNNIAMAVLDDEEIWQNGVSLSQVSINQTVPLALDPVRFLLSFLVIFLVSVFFPGSPLWHIPLNFQSFRQMGSVIALLLLFTGYFIWTVFSSYTGSDRSMTEQKAALNENYQQYDRLVDALMVPRYALLETPHHYLEKDGDPYDMKLREERQFDYPWDTAYYQGRYYVYFGAVPAVLVLLPYKLLTGNDLPLDFPILGFGILFLFGLFGVYTRIVKRCFSSISFGLFWTGLFLLLTSCNLTWCLRRTLVYELAIISGICFSVWGIYFMLLAGEAGRFAPVCLIFSGACSALAVGCRPTMLFVSIVVFMLGAMNMKENRRVFHAVLFLFPYILIGLALMKYNYERFGDPFEFGITYQLTTENRAVGIPLLGFFGRFLSIFSSLFTFPTVDMNFPFIHLHTPELAYNGLILNSDMILGVFSYPVMMFLILMPFLRRSLVSRGKIMLPFCAACLISAAGICVTASAYAVTNRYLTDYLYLLALPSVFSMFCVYNKFEKAGWGQAAQAVIGIFAVVSAALFAALSLTGEDNWFQLINPFYYERLCYALSPWL